MVKECSFWKFVVKAVGDAGGRRVMAKVSSDSNWAAN